MAAIIVAIFAAMTLEVAHRVLIVFVATALVRLITYLTPCHLISFEDGWHAVDVHVLILLGSMITVVVSSLFLSAHVTLGESVARYVGWAVAIPLVLRASRGGRRPRAPAAAPRPGGWPLPTTGRTTRKGMDLDGTRGAELARPRRTKRAACSAPSGTATCGSTVRRLP